MDKEPNVILRGGRADGEVAYVSAPGEPLSHEDDGGGSITYVDSNEVEERDGKRLRVYVPRH